MTELGGRARASSRSILLAAVLGAAFLLMWRGNPALLAHAPPLIERDARAISIVLLVGTHGALLLLMLAAIRLASRRLAGLARVVAVGACLLAVAGAMVWVNFALYASVHFLCHYAGACRSTNLPESVMYALTAGSASPLLAECVLLPLIAWLALRVFRAR